jgi:hypothetical protein
MVTSSPIQNPGNPEADNDQEIKSAAGSPSSQAGISVLTGAPGNDDFAAGIGKLVGRANLRLMERFPAAASQGMEAGWA